MKKISTVSHADLPTSSERSVLSALLRSGAVARSEVTSLTNLSQQSVHRIVDTLERRKFLKLRDPETRGRGKPSPNVTIDTQHYSSIGISIGTEEIRVCAMDLAGQPIAEDTLSVDPGDPDKVRDAFEEKLEFWLSGVLEQSVILGIGVAIQGHGIEKPGFYLTPTPLAAWANLPLAEFFGSHLGLAAFSENNATCSATAEFYLGIGSSKRCLAYLSFNYGFGAGLFVDGDAFRGGHGNAGEISSIYDADQARTRPALGELVQRIDEQTKGNSTVRELVVNFDPDNAVVLNWLDEVTPQLCLALRALKAVADPNIIIFGGEAPESLKKLLIERSANAFAAQTSPSPLLVSSKIPYDPAHLGAALLPQHRMIF